MKKIIFALWDRVHQVNADRLLGHVIIGVYSFIPTAWILYAWLFVGYNAAIIAAVPCMCSYMLARRLKLSRWHEDFNKRIDSLEKTAMNYLSSSAYYADVEYVDEEHLELGWYYWDKEYPEDGMIGPFDSKEEAIQSAKNKGYIVAFDDV